MFAPLWQKLDKISKYPTLLFRIPLGLLLASLSFGIFALAANVATPNMANSALELVVAGNFTLGVGELCIGPAMTAAVTYLAPKHLQGTFMGIWFLSIAISSYLGSVMAEASAEPNKIISYNVGATLYQHSFSLVAFIVLVVALLSILLFPALKKLMRNPLNN